MNCNKTGDIGKDILVNIRIVGRKGWQTGAEPRLLDALLVSLGFSFSWLEGQREEVLVSLRLFVHLCLIKKSTPAAAVTPRLFSVPWPEGAAVCPHR